MKLPKHRGTDFVGIDPSLTGFGMAVLGSVTSSLIVPSTETGPRRLAELRDGMLGVLGALRPRIIMVDGYSYESKFNREVMAEIGGIVRVALWEHYHLRKSPPTIAIVPPPNMKKFVGARRKDEIRLAVYKQWGFEAKTDDEVDAHALAQYGRAYVGDAAPLNQRQREALAALRKDSTHLLLC